MRKLLCAIVFLLVPLTAAMAVEPDEILPDATLESRARALSAELRCLVCQNQSIDESDAPLARDLRLLIREQLQRGSSDAEVKRYIVSRYGDFVLLKPPFTLRTLLLWTLPFLFLITGILFLLSRSARGFATLEAPLTEEERHRLERLAGPAGDTPSPTLPRKREREHPAKEGDITKLSSP
jgi:cytochrome c-type biogenesis protein CcmH